MSHDNLIVFGSLAITLAFFVVLTIGVVMGSNRAQKQRAWLTEHGKVIAATVTQSTDIRPSSGGKGLWEWIWGILTFISVLGGQQPVEPAAPASPPARRIVADWFDPQTNQHYKFRADVPLPQARRYRVGKPIPVLIDEHDPTRYWMAPPDQ